MRLLTLFEMTLRDLARRRGALALLTAVPLAFYLARHDRTGQSIRFASLGLAWAVSTLGLFAGVAGRALEPRLRLGGYRPLELLAGRLAALVVVGLVLAGLYLGLIAADQDGVRVWAVGLELALTALVAAPLGLLLGAVVPRELEGAMLLITLMGVQFIMDPATHASRLLPFWSTRELGTYAVDLTDAGYLTRGVAHGLAVTAVLLLANAVLTGVRLRRRGHLTVSEPV